jgi:hypothetical protein
MVFLEKVLSLSCHEKASTHIILSAAKNLGSHFCTMEVTEILRCAQNGMSGDVGHFPVSHRSRHAVVVAMLA